MNKVLIIIPAFNEEENLDNLLQKLSKEEIRNFADILIINDASSDKTIDIASSYSITTITHIFNLGYGSALQVGYKYATRNNYNYVIQLDADGQHDISNIAIIYENITSKDEKGNMPDIVIGSRFLDGSDSYNVSLIRKCSMKWFSWIIKRVTNNIITDPTSGLQGLSKPAFEYYSEYGNFDFNYPDSNMIIQMFLLGFNIKEFPAVMHERTVGVSMHSGLLKQIIYMLTMPISIYAVVIRIKRGLQKQKSDKSTNVEKIQI